MEHQAKVEEIKSQAVKDKQLSNNNNKVSCENTQSLHENVNKQKQQKPQMQSKAIEDIVEKNVQLQKNQAKQVSYTPAQIQLKKELESMQFEPYLIEEAIQQASNLQQAIEFIITQIQTNEQKELIGTEANEVKVYFIVRMDLKMGTGKIAAQVGHAALKGYQQMRYSASMNDKNAGLLIQWMQNGKKTKILQAQTQYEIRGYLDRASQKLINHCNIRDAGRTQIAAGSMTVGAIGPVRQCDVGFLKNLQEL